MVFLHSSLNLEMAPVCTVQRQVVQKSTITLFPGCKQNRSQVSQWARYSSCLTPLSLPACLRLPGAITEMYPLRLVAIPSCIPTLSVGTAKIKRWRDNGRDLRQKWAP